MSAQTESARLEHDVYKLLQLLKSNDLEALRAFLEQCPPNEWNNLAGDSPSLDARLTALNSSAQSYSRGIHPQLGIRLGKAIYLYSLELFDQSQSTFRLHIAGQAAINCVIGFNALGRHKELITFAEAAEQYFEEKENLHVKLDLLLARIQALIDLGRFEEAEVLLHQVDQHISLKDPREVAVHRIRLESLDQRVKQALRPATELPSTEPPISDKEVMIEDRRSKLEAFRALGEILQPEDEDLAALVDNFVAKSLNQEELEKDLPASLADWAVEAQNRNDHLTDFLSGKSPRDVIRDYSKSIGRPDLIEKLLGETPLLDDESEDSEQPSQSQSNSA